MRVGFGARQSYFTDTYDLNSSGTIANKLEDQTSTGLEAVLLLRSRFSRFPAWIRSLTSSSGDGHRHLGIHLGKPLALAAQSLRQRGRRL